MATAKPKNDSKEAPKTIDGFKVKQVITLPLFKWVVDSPRYLRADAPIYLGKEVKGTGEAAKMEPAHLMNVTDLQSGEQGQVIIGAVLKGILEDTFPDESYVGKGFQVTQYKVEGKRYKGYRVLEVEVPG